METKTPREFVEKTLPAIFKPDKAASIDVIVQLNLTGPNGGDWIATIKNQTLQVTEGIHPSPTLTVKIADSDFMDLVSGKLSGTQAFFAGKIQFIGNFSLALKLKDTGFLDFGS